MEVWSCWKDGHLAFAFRLQQIFIFRFRGWETERLKKKFFLIANSCTNLKLEQRYSCVLQMRLQIKNWDGLSIALKHGSCDNTNMFVCTVFAQITCQIYLTDPQFNKWPAPGWSCEGGHVSLIASESKQRCHLTRQASQFQAVLLQLCQGSESESEVAFLHFLLLVFFLDSV